MTTLHDIQTRDITADEIKAMVVAYDAIRKNRDTQIADLDNETVYDKFWYYIHSIARLSFSGIDAKTTTLAIARRLIGEDSHKTYTTEIALVGNGGAELMKFVWNGKHAIVTGSNGVVIAEGEWRADVRPMFKSIKTAAREEKAAQKKAKKAEASKTESVLKEAAAPAKKAKSDDAATAMTVSSTADEIDALLDEGSN